MNTFKYYLNKNCKETSEYSNSMGKYYKKI